MEYSRLKLSTLRWETVNGAEGVLTMCERIIKPRMLSDMAKRSTLERLKQELLRGAGGLGPRSPYSVNRYLPTVTAALIWAAELEWLPNHRSVQRIISVIGKRARVVVNDSGPCASAHDLRRSFGQRLADAGVNVRDLQAIMRHSSIRTTETYYLRHRTQDVADRLAQKLGVGPVPVEDRCVG